MSEAFGYISALVIDSPFQLLAHVSVTLAELQCLLGWTILRFSFLVSLVFLGSSSSHTACCVFAPLWTDLTFRSVSAADMSEGTRSIERWKPQRLTADQSYTSQLLAGKKYLPGAFEGRNVKPCGQNKRWECWIGSNHKGVYSQRKTVFILHICFQNEKGIKVDNAHYISEKQYFSNDCNYVQELN